MDNWNSKGRNSFEQADLYGKFQLKSKIMKKEYSLDLQEL